MKLPFPSLQPQAETSRPPRDPAVAPQECLETTSGWGWVLPLLLRATGLTRALLLLRWLPRPQSSVAALFGESFPLPALIVPHPCIPSPAGGLWKVGEGSFLPLPASCPGCLSPWPGLVSPWRGSGASQVDEQTELSWGAGAGNWAPGSSQAGRGGAGRR